MICALHRFLFIAFDYVTKLSVIINCVEMFTQRVIGCEAFNLRN
jgi:hypothetical protein